MAADFFEPPPLQAVSLVGQLALGLLSLDASLTSSAATAGIEDVASAAGGTAAGVRVDVDVNGVGQALRLLHRLTSRLEDGTPRLRSLVDQLIAAEQERFGGAARWKRLSPETVRIDQQQGRDPRPLVLTGALMRSLTEHGAPGQIVRVTPTTLTFGTSIFYARFHQRGERVPRRTVVGLTRLQRKSIVAELRQMLFEGL